MGNPEVVETAAGVPKKWKGSDLLYRGKARCFFGLISENLRVPVAAMWCLLDSRAKSIFVQ
jgi:hypothetical protein